MILVSADANDKYNELTFGKPGRAYEGNPIVTQRKPRTSAAIVSIRISISYYSLHSCVVFDF